MTTEKAYEILGVAPGSDPKSVQKAYRLKAMTCHPDKAGSEAQTAGLTKRFIEVRDAYEHLRNEGFPMPETEEILDDVMGPDFEFPPMTPAGRSFAPRKPDELQESIGQAEKLGLGFSWDLESWSMWVVIIPAGAVTLVLFVRYLLRLLTA